MICEETFQRLAALEGKISEAEGRRLAEIAGEVPVEQAIVELGSFKGKSTCYLGVGSRHGGGARVYAVDLWQQHSSPEYGDPAVFSEWRRQVSSLDLQETVLPVRCDSASLGRLFVLPVGLLFIDGHHSYDSVKADFHAWATKIVEGGYLAFHDDVHRATGFGVRRFVDQHLVPSADWCDLEVVDSLCVIRRSGRPEPDDAGLTYVVNEELAEHLSFRPPQYAFELAKIVRKRDAAGIYIDTHSPHYQALVEKYRDARVARPVPLRVGQICQDCPVGASCEFPRLASEQRSEILQSRDPAELRKWCRTKAWGHKIDVVYPYIENEARGQELRFSMRSVETNLVGTPRFWVVGERPDWYSGNHIPHQRLPRQRHLPRLDRAAKLWRVVKQRAIQNEFLWMMDDLYFVQPVVMDELRRKWKCGEMNAELLETYDATNAWMWEKRVTWEALAAAGRPLDDQANHLPIAYEKDKVRRLFRKYRLLKQPLVDNLLYSNEFATHPPRHCRAILYRETGKPSADEIRRRLSSALIVNHVDESFTPAMEQVLSELFPDPCSVERP